MPTEELPTQAEPLEAVATPAKPVDLSAEIAQAVAKQPGDRVRVARVWGDHYRCNWLAPTPRVDGGMLETFRIRHSRFLKVTRGQDGALIITDMTAPN
jgi:hypothetical protein